jgi:predicted TIM-barrel fold metal-dependent hydrolase
MPERKGIVDCHVHLWKVDMADRMVQIADIVGSERISIVCTINPEKVNANPAALVCKARYPERVYAFCGLDHSQRLSDGEVKTPSLAEQVDRLIAMGADGIKMLEGKPTTHRFLPVPVDDEYFEAYFKRVEETRFPILWHVNDPEEFWDPELLPGWAKAHDWGYNENDIQKEEQYEQVERVLERHPALVVIFAHFYFLSADLPRAARLLERYEGVHFDLAPGVEMLYNMSRNVPEAREFFIRFADRIVYGTDLAADMSDAESRIRAALVTRWLETGDEYRVDPAADELLGPPEDGIVRGLSLPDATLEKIYRTNFERIAGAMPRPFDAELAAEECRRIAAIAKDPTEATKASEVLGSMA